MISKKTSSYFFVTFLICLSLDILGGELNNLTLIFIFKPALMFILMAWVATVDFKHHLKFIIALLFSFLGDVILMIPNHELFLFGLGSFLITHMLYIFIFFKKTTFKWDSLFNFAALFLLFYFVVIKNNMTQEFKLPVIIYSLVIIGMSTTLRSIREKSLNRNLLVLGSILFMISDALIAVNKFSAPIPYPTMLIMSTYGIAQLLITVGYLHFFQGKN